MKRKKGFTLIELLAIIVILAIIAVITVPIILNVIENSKKGAAQDSAYGYKASVMDYYATLLAQDNNLRLNGQYTVSNGTLTGDFGGTTESKNIPISGTKPTSGALAYTNSVLTGGCLVIDEYAVVFGTDGTITNTVKGKCKGIKLAPSVPDPESLSTDSWATIANAIDEGNTDLYNIGDTKEVVIDNVSYTVRLSNKTYVGCDPETKGFSQTACGFVFEFVDVLSETHVMNSGGTNVGGWPASSMYDYLNTGDSSIYSKLPSDLKAVIADTYTVSGHGSTEGETNFTSRNKLYLLARQEVFGDNTNDTAYDNTKQLEYYQINTAQSNRVKYTTDATPQASKWFLRTPVQHVDSSFYDIDYNGSNDGRSGSEAYGVAPAFRIGSTTPNSTICTESPVTSSTPNPSSFATDSWATIKKGIDNDTNVYSVGDTKEVIIQNKSYTVRISNITTTGCGTQANGFSQTACGYVFEFIDPVGFDKTMNPTETNVGGWPASSMYTYLNTGNRSIYGLLPCDLQAVIADTYTVSGHGDTTGETNFESTNKLYLLSKQEVFGNSDYDTAADKTKQLEYYQSNSKVKTDINSSNIFWWLRTALSYTNSAFCDVDIYGSFDARGATNAYGVTPAFRIIKN